MKFPWVHSNHSVPILCPITVLNTGIATILFMSFEKLNSQTRGCQHLKPNKVQTTITIWHNLFKSNKDFTEKSCSCFPDSIQSISKPPVPKVLWDVRSVADGYIQKCMFSLFAKSGCASHDKKFPETASLFNLVFHGWLVGFLLQCATWASDCWLDCFTWPRFTIRDFQCKVLNFVCLFIND